MPSTRAGAALAIPLAVALALTACSGPGAQGDGPHGDARASPGDAAGPDDTGGAGGPRVVTSVFSLAALAQEIAPHADVRLLTAGGQDPHDVELSPADRAAIADADLALYMGDIGYQPQVEDAIADRAGEVVSVVEAVGRGRLHTVGHDHAAGGSGDGGTIDPHAWLAPGLMARVAEALGAGLAAVDRERTDAHEAAAADVAAELTDVATRVDARLSDCTHQTALVGHEAWAYLLEPRGLAQQGISGAGGHAQASPQQLAELTDLIEAEGIPGVFAEPREGRRDAEALAAEADVELLEVDPLETPADAGAWLERGYVDLLLAQVEVFAEGLGCRP